MSTLISTPFSTPQRLHERGTAERDTINKILDLALMCHLGYVVDGRPVVTPTAYWREGNHVYWHGSSASRMMRTLAKGGELCFTVSLLDGLVLARSAFHHSVNYRSVMLFGSAEVINDSEMKKQLLENFIEHLYPGRNAQLRPMNTQEVKATALLRLEINEGSAKVRTGPPKDDEEDMSTKVWAGVGNFDHRVQHWEADDHTQAHHSNLSHPIPIAVFFRGEH